jgi:hypothetical protein
MHEKNTIQYSYGTPSTYSYSGTADYLHLCLYLYLYFYLCLWYLVEAEPLLT